jgi:methanogenic corrinoid protein MtbC1
MEATLMQGSDMSSGIAPSVAERLLPRYFEPLVSGRRSEARGVVLEALASGFPARTLYHGLIWPAMERVDRLYREDRISTAAQNMAMIINRVVADQLQQHLPRREANGRRILITSASGEQEELGAQMCADLFESDGWEVFFIGAGVPRDELITLVHELRPDLLLIFGSKPQDAPGVRTLIEEIRAINANPAMNIMVSGGVFNRANGLWREVKADLFAETAVEALDRAARAEPREAEGGEGNGVKKRRRRRRPPLLVQPGDDD